MFPRPPLVGDQGPHGRPASAGLPVLRQGEGEAMNAPEVSLFVTPAERWEKVLELRDRFCEAKQDDDMIAGMTVADFLLDFIADSREPIRGALAERDTLLAHVPARAVAALRTERGG